MIKITSNRNNIFNNDPCIIYILQYMYNTVNIQLSWCERDTIRNDKKYFSLLANISMRIFNLQEQK